MKKVLVLLLVLIQSVFLFSADDVVVKRYAILVGANDGGKGRAILRYAETDAKLLANILTEVGGIDPQNSILLLNPTKSSLIRSFENIRNHLDQNSNTSRTELIFYYSGHSDEEGLLIRDDHFTYSDLRASLENTNVDVRIGILDSCSSGAFTLLKGGTHTTPFLIDESVKTSGHAYITSTSESESAQESNKIQASFFTHFFAAALRGAGDTSGDGKVTLHEAYSYASKETLARTEKTLAGAQHASYDFRLTGHGDVVLTDIRNSESTLILEETDYGRIFIRDEEYNLISEINKKFGLELKISLPSSSYNIIKEVDGNYYRQSLVLITGESGIAVIGNYKEFTPEANVIRGTTLAFKEPAEDILKPTAFFGWSSKNKTREISGDIDFFSRGYSLNGYQLSLGNLIIYDAYGAQLGLFFNVAGNNLSGVQISTFFNIASGDSEHYGIQLSGLFNRMGGSGKTFNLQGAGLFNISKDLPGIQLAGLFNTAEKVNGVQISGIFNKSLNLNGVQIGLINKADFVKGVQIGLINVNKDIKGLSLGLINVSTEGIKDFSYYFDWQKQIFGVNYQFGSSLFYHLGYVEVPKDVETSNNFSLGFGGGVHIPLWKLYTEADISLKSDFNYGNEVNYVRTFPVIRAKLGLPLWGNVAAFIGASLNFPNVDSNFDYDYFNNYNNFIPTYFFGIKL